MRSQTPFRDSARVQKSETAANAFLSYDLIDHIKFHLRNALIDSSNPFGGR